VPLITLLRHNLFVSKPREAQTERRNGMNMIYNSANYCVVEFKSDEGKFSQGYEIMDKAARREIYLAGALAEQFKENVQQLISREPSVEQVDDFLSQFEGLMQQPLVLH
jgi:Protein of unknown function (DUF3567)